MALTLTRAFFRGKRGGGQIQYQYNLRQLKVIRLKVKSIEILKMRTLSTTC